VLGKGAMMECDGPRTAALEARKKEAAAVAAKKAK
jgi:hypothetical protein